MHNDLQCTTTNNPPTYTNAHSSDAVMLSAESAAGRFPVESVTMQQLIINKVESDGVFRTSLDRFAAEVDVLHEKDAITAAITIAARQVGFNFVSMRDVIFHVMKGLWMFLILDSCLPCAFLLQFP